MTGRNIIVVGASAGGLAAIDKLVAQLRADVPASLFVVQHMAADANGDALLHQLRKHDTLGCKLAQNGETFKPGTIYIAPPDQHMLVKERTMLVTKGARENRSRPAIDPLFRSAAVTHGSRVIGVLLTGMLDDGTAGMQAVKKCGGSRSCRTQPMPPIRRCRRARSTTPRSITVSHSPRWAVSSSS